jgi:hypothetical protein
MQILNQVLELNALVSLLGDFKNSFAGYIYRMDFTEALVLTNDKWKERINGIPHNSFLVAASFNPGKFSEAHDFDKEVILLRVLGPAPLPEDSERLKTIIENNQRKDVDEAFAADELNGFDPVTQSELQFGGLRCRPLGTFYVEDNQLKLGSDIENYLASNRMRVYKPRGDALEIIVNYVDPISRNKAEEEALKVGFQALPSPFQIGTIRYTSTARLHRSKAEQLVPLMIQPSDFLARRTAVFGMTRTGKSNTIKTTIAAVKLASIRDDVPVGQLIFDINGEYANATHQDDGSSIADVFGVDQVERFRGIKTEGFKDFRLNFYEDCADALALLKDLVQDDPSKKPATDMANFLGASLETPAQEDYSAKYRFERRRSMFHCILHRANYPKPPNLQNVKFSVGEAATKHIEAWMAKNERDWDTSNSEPRKLPNPKAGLSFDEACRFFALMQEANQKSKIPSSTKGSDLLEADDEAFLAVLSGRSSTNLSNIIGSKFLQPYSEFHSPTGLTNLPTTIYNLLRSGKIVILDLSVGSPRIRESLSKRIAHYIFIKSMESINRGDMPPSIVLYIEEAHNLIGRKDDLTDTWPRVAKEGAKAKIALVYATQEPSSIHPNILANTENWFVTHLNNEDELRSLGKFYDFADFHDSLKSAQDVGFARIKTLSSPFVIPTQIDRFTPNELKQKLKELEF